MTQRWTVRLTASADQDIQDILRWTRNQFGEYQAQAYSTTLFSAVKALADGFQTIGLKHRPEIGKDIYTLHVARSHKKGRHFVVCRLARNHEVDVLRLLHDAMDLEQHAGNLP